ncbi:hypothetical protein ACHAC9_20310 [Massilia sp. CMS3.1]|uniref:hypothetical protein n=1 Tax=Massilia sp. CMS3.1 TaxID=3373083 RepID=UPI003EE61E24
MSKMNKKLATLLFAIGLGVSASSAMAVGSCQWNCKLAYDACMKSGEDALQCDMDRLDCYSRCGI